MAMKRNPKEPTHADRMAQFVPAIVSRREREASRRLSASNRRANSEQTGFDPLELRLGLRTWQRENRSGYVVSNPIYDEILTRGGGKHDDSLPGVAWLRTVYHGNRRDLVTLPGVRAVLQARAKAIADQYRQPEPPKAPRPQGDLFTEVA